MLLNRALEANLFNDESFLKLENAITIAEHLAATIAVSPDLCQTILTVMSDCARLALLHQFVKHPPVLPLDPTFQTIHVCHCAMNNIRFRLRKLITLILLNSVLRCPREEHAAFKSVLAPLVAGLEIAPDISCNKQPRRSMGAPIPLFEAKSTPQTLSISHEWRKSLTMELVSDAHHRSDAVARLVGQICRDLELRCEEVERPLHEEQSRSRDLEAKLVRSESILHGLETDTEHVYLKLKDLGHANGALEEQVSSKDKLLQELSSKLGQVQQDLHCAKEDAERNAQTAIESARQQDIAYLATLASKDQMLDDQASNLVARERQVKSLEDDLAQIRAQECKTAEKTLEQSVIIEELRRIRSDQGGLLESNEREISQLVKSVADSQAMTHKASAKANVAINERDTTIARLKAQLLAADTEVIELSETHRLKMAERAAALSSYKEQANAKIRALEVEVQQSRSEATKELEARNMAIADFESKFERCWREQQAQERASAEAQDLVSKLTAIVGTKYSVAIGSTEEAGSNKQASDHNDATVHQGGQPIKRARSRSSASSTSCGAQGNVIFENSDSHHDPKIAFAKHGKAQLNKKNAGLRPSNRTPLTALSNPRPTLSQISPVPRQSKSLEKTFAPSLRVSDGTDENAKPRIESDESFGDLDIFTSTNPDQLLAITSSCVSDETTCGS